MWERACSRIRRVSQYSWRLIHRLREQASSHIFDQCLQRLVAVAAVIDGKRETFDPLYAGLQPPVGVQAQPAVTRRLLADLEVFAARRELNAGRRRRQQAHAVAIAVDFLMHMAPEQRLDLWKAVEHRKQSLRVAQADGLHPRTANGHRIMV